MEFWELKNRVWDPKDSFWRPGGFFVKNVTLTLPPQTAPTPFPSPEGLFPHPHGIFTPSRGFRRVGGGGAKSVFATARNVLFFNFLNGALGAAWRFSPQKETPEPTYQRPANRGFGKLKPIIHGVGGVGGWWRVCVGGPKKDLRRFRGGFRILPC